MIETCFYFDTVDIEKVFDVEDMRPLPHPYAMLIVGRPKVEGKFYCLGSLSNSPSRKGRIMLISKTTPFREG